MWSCSEGSTVHVFYGARPPSHRLGVPQVADRINALPESLVPCANRTTGTFWSDMGMRPLLGRGEELPIPAQGRLEAALEREEGRPAEKVAGLAGIQVLDPNLV